jgi:hypothetical protein
MIRILMTIAVIGFTEHVVFAGSGIYGPTQETELVVAYFGAMNCGPCRMPGMKEAVAEAQRTFAARAKMAGHRFATMGVAVDRDVQRGIEYLDAFGKFDEVVAGKDFENIATLELMLSDDSDIPIGIPQLIVYERTITYDKNRFRADKPTIIVRAPGTAIPAWVKEGCKTE